MAPREPTALKRAKGVTRTRLNEVEPEPVAELPTAPGWLSDPARAVFERVVADLAYMGLASSADVDNLVAYAQAVIEHQRASMLVAKQGVIVFGERGQQVRNPACVVTQQASTTMLRLAREFGLTPSARAAMGTKHKPLKDEEAARLLA